MAKAWPAVRLCHGTGWVHPPHNSLCRCSDSGGISAPQARLGQRKASSQFSASASCGHITPFAEYRFALERFAPPRFAPRRFAPWRFAPERSASLKSVLERFDAARKAPAALAKRRFFSPRSDPLITERSLPSQRDGRVETSAFSRLGLDGRFRMRNCPRLVWLKVDCSQDSGTSSTLTHERKKKIEAARARVGQTTHGRRDRTRFRHEASVSSLAPRSVRVVWR